MSRGLNSSAVSYLAVSWAMCLSLSEPQFCHHKKVAKMVFMVGSDIDWLTLCRWGSCEILAGHHSQQP